MVSILSWNIRQGGGSRVAKILAAIFELDPSVIVLSEFRNNDKGVQIRTALLKRGFIHQVVSGAAKEINSVLIASKFPCGSGLFPDCDKNYPHSIVRADLDAFWLYGVYLPHKKKHRLFEFLLEQELADDEPAIVTGDWNTGKNGIDQVGNSFWYSEHLTTFEERGYFDAFRAVHGDVREYSWFSHQGNGFRYDHTYMHESLRSILKDCQFLHKWREAGLSDHSPMVIKLGT